jgi:hypothetical protein
MRQLPDVLHGSTFAAAAKKSATPPRCAICEYAKGHRKPPHEKTSTSNTEREGALNVKTRHVLGSITDTLERCPADFNFANWPQYQVVYDDLFSMVRSIGIEDDAPDFWKTLLVDSRLQVPLDTEGSDAQVFLRDDWLSTSEEIDAKRRYNARVHLVRSSSLSSRGPRRR